MARRNALNSRYQKGQEPAGQTRKSAASAKPKRALGTSSGSTPTKAKTGANRKPAEPPKWKTPEYDKLRKRWWFYMARYEIYVTYKQGIFDPPGATAERALVNLGYEGIDEVKIGKYIRIDADADLAYRCGDVREAARQSGHRGLPHRNGRGGVACASASSSSPAPTASRTSSRLRRSTSVSSRLRLAWRHRPVRLRRHRAARRLSATATTSAAVRWRASAP
jgi:phosphoribosylformylglycinamidine synthase subunit PurS